MQYHIKTLLQILRRRRRVDPTKKFLQMRMQARRAPFHRLRLQTKVLADFTARRRQEVVQNMRPTAWLAAPGFHRLRT